MRVSRRHWGWTYILTDVNLFIILTMRTKGTIVPKFHPESLKNKEDDVSIFRVKQIFDLK